MQTEFLLSGFGGQGIMFAGQLLTYAGMEAGLEVTWIPSYGPEMRGGTAHCTVILSDKPIGSPLVRHPQVVLAFNLPSFDKYAPLVKTGGLLVYNYSLVKQAYTREDIRVIAIPATQMADELGEAKLTNLVMLGAALTQSGVLSLENIETSLEQHLPAHRRSLLAANLQALERGQMFALGRL